MPPLSTPQSNSFNPVHTRALLRFGGWVAVSSVVSPLLAQADRFFIGAMMSATAVTDYVVPYELTVQSLILMGAVTTVAFPTIANLARTSESAARSSIAKACVFDTCLLCAWPLFFWHIGFSLAYAVYSMSNTSDANM